MFSAAYSGDIPANFITLTPSHFTEFVVDFFSPDGIANPFGVVDEDITALLAEAEGLSLAEAEPIWQQISTLITERCYLIAVTSGSLVVATTPQIENTRPMLNQPARLDFHALTLADE